MTTEANLFEEIVSRYQEPLYRFAFSLCRAQADAEDLVQGTFYVWATKGDQLRDPAKVKTWLFTTLHRQFLESRRRQVRFPHYELAQVDAELHRRLPRARGRGTTAPRCSRRWRRWMKFIRRRSRCFISKIIRIVKSRKFSASRWAPCNPASPAAKPNSTSG